MAALLPGNFTGEDKQSWSDWLHHFESAAVVNGWDTTARVMWIRTRLMGRAAMVVKRLSAEDKTSYDAIVAALRRRFKPNFMKEENLRKFEQRRKQQTEDWVAFGEDLITLVEKAYPTLQANALEVLALNHFISKIADPQLAFGVPQRRPTTLNEAVAVTQELVSYVHGRTLENRHKQLGGCEWCCDWV